MNRDRDDTEEVSGEKFPFVSDSEEQTRSLGAACARESQPGDIYLLSGTLGTGKTQFVKGFARALGVSESDISSPTFTLAHEYQGDFGIVHMDLYRIRSDKDAVISGIEAYFYTESIVLVEWPEKAASVIPPGATTLRFEHEGDDRRRIRLLSGPDPLQRTKSSPI